MEEILAGLNEAQKKALTTTEGYIRVIAGAGSGKTRALAARFAYLVEAIGILPGNILCVTFTNKSATEMRQRIHRLSVLFIVSVYPFFRRTVMPFPIRKTFRCWITRISTPC